MLSANELCILLFPLISAIWEDQNVKEVLG